MSADQPTMPMPAAGAEQPLIWLEVSEASWSAVRGPRLVGSITFVDGHFVAKHSERAALEYHSSLHAAKQSLEADAFAHSVPVLRWSDKLTAWAAPARYRRRGLTNR